MGDPPGPQGAQSFEDLAGRLRALRSWAGVSYHEVHRRVVSFRRARGIAELPSYNTVFRCFQAGRTRMDAELVVHIARVLLGEEDATAAEWRLAHQVITGVATEAEIVRVNSSLPDDIAEFTGRADELDMILAGPGVVVIEGMAGVGKTVLATRAAHLLLRQGNYSDLQLSVNLRGYDRERPPADPAAVLDGFLRHLGLSGDRIHAMSLAARGAAFRKLLVGRKALVLLDNAMSEDQVRPLLPESPDALVLVTSRRTLPELPGARRLPLTVFGQNEVLDLLRRSAGADLIAADLDTATRIGELVGRLPLAVGLVAGIIADRPHWTLADHLLRLTERHDHRHLDSGVELALDLSYRALPAGHQRTFRLTALHPGPDFGADAAAALAGVDPDLAQRHLDDLLADHLLQLKAPSRYELHDLVRVFADARVVDEEPKSAQREALTRLFDHYLQTAAAARNTLNPAERHECAPVASVADARAWLETEHTNLMAIADHTARHGWHRHTARLMTILAKHLDMTGRHHDAITLYQHVLNTGDLADQGAALHNLGRVHWRLGDHDSSLDHFARALEIHRATGNRAGEAAAFNNMGNVHQRLGHYALALQLYLRALVLRRELGDRVGEGATVGNVGIIYHRMGRYQEAFLHYRQALVIRREVGDREGEGAVLANIAETHQCLQQWRPARDHYEQALAIFDELDDRSNRSYALAYLAQVLMRLGFTKLALDHHDEALALAREVGELSVETEALNRYGETLTALGRPASARPFHERALELASQTGIRFERARALDGLAAALSRAGRHEEALRHRAEAVALFADLNLPVPSASRESARPLDTGRAATPGSPAPAAR
ncbi:tetratricopeptide repeat protein [Lentzea roselyniae]|nr:tetratricopeptide repeat protein [Lentzea atacamensis]